MNIYELYNHLQDESFLEKLKGELKLEGNCIIWSYNLNESTEEIEVPNYNDDDEEDFTYAFNVVSSEESLQETCDGELELIKQYINELDEFNDWSFSDPDVDDTTISFKIF